LPPAQSDFEFDGFYAPVVNVPTVNVVEAGSTVPLKFSLGGDHGLAIFAEGYPASASRSCSGGQTGPLEPTALPGGATLTYNSGSGRYQYNWKTSDAWAGQCRTLVVRFVDGTQVTAEFRFKPKPR
ncbi:MAG TPA: PxKF domain-containing protein, partial [Ilumatobacteraceae bacterium]|nr:PxKF domain-containing protein [Ilumatobacteraceae bacterium]